MLMNILGDKSELSAVDVTSIWILYLMEQNRRVIFCRKRSIVTSHCSSWGFCCSYRRSCVWKGVGEMLKSHEVHLEECVWLSLILQHCSVHNLQTYVVTVHRSTHTQGMWLCVHTSASLTPFKCLIFWSHPSRWAHGKCERGLMGVKFHRYIGLCSSSQLLVRIFLFFIIK